MKMKKIALFVFVGVFLLAACGSGSDANAPGQDEIGTLTPVPAEYAGKTVPLGLDAADEGEKVFQSNCATCHGSQGHGNGPASGSLDPKPKNLALLQKNAGDDYLFWRISEGKPGTSMVAWKGILDDEQIWQTVSFIRTLADQETVVFLSTEGVRLAVQGYADHIHEEGFAPLKDLMANFAAAGGTIHVCSPCFKKRGLDEHQLVAGAKIVGGAKLVEFLAGGAPCVSF